MEVDIFIPCFIDQVYPETGMNMVRILEKFGAIVFYNDQQTCCGQMAFNSGFWDEAKAMGEKFIKDFSSDRYVVGPSASCVGMVRNYYPKLFHNSSLHNECKQLQKKIFEFTDFLVNVMKVTNTGAVFEKKVTYHASCASLREYGLNDEPFQLLKNVKGLELIEMENADTCCGFGGTFSVKYEPISTAMAEQKVEWAKKTGAEYIVSTDSSCLMHLDTFMKKHNVDMKVMHLADLLVQGW